MKIDIVILAAGKGTRMYSDRPKVLHCIGGKPMVRHVLDAAKTLGDVRVNVIVGHQAGQIREELGGAVQFIEQEPQLGTGHAMMQALPVLRNDALCLVLYGDVPLIAPSTLKQLLAISGADRVALLTAELNDATGYGRIIRDHQNAIVEIVEQRDASKEQLTVTEINSGIMCVPQSLLSKWLPRLSNTNSQNEYYLTDLIKFAVEDTIDIASTQPEHLCEIEGVNNKVQLAGLERVYQYKRATTLLEKGVTLADPNRLDIRGEIRCGKDVFIDINAVFMGNVVLGDNVSVGPNCVIEDSVIGSGTQIFANTTIENADIADQCTIGPFARLRPGTTLHSKAKLGNFVEVKNSTIRDGSKVNHLAYVGDADIGADSNIGAGTIVCNYDGVYKHKTKLGERVFIGSNSTLVAPLEIEDDGFVAAGSTVTKTVSEGKLAIGRARQRNIDGWKRPKKK